MVKQRKKNTKKKFNGKGFKENGTGARKINASTVFETCTEQLSPFGGLLPLIKFFDLVGFKEIERFEKLARFLILLFSKFFKKGEAKLTSN